MRNASCFWAQPVLPTANGQSSDVLPAEEIGWGSDQTLFRNGHLESIPAGVDPGPPSGNEDEGLKEEAQVLARWRRFKLLALVGRPYKVNELDLPDRQAVKDWMWNEHYSRRNYTIEAKSYARGRQLLALQRDHGGDRPSKDFKSNPLDLKTGITALIARYQAKRASLYLDAKSAATPDRLIERTCAAHSQ